MASFCHNLFGISTRHGRVFKLAAMACSFVIPSFQPTLADSQRFVVDFHLPAGYFGYFAVASDSVVSFEFVLPPAPYFTPDIDELYISRTYWGGVPAIYIDGVPQNDFDGGAWVNSYSGSEIIERRCSVALSVDFFGRDSHSSFRTNPITIARGTLPFDPSPSADATWRAELISAMNGLSSNTENVVEFQHSDHEQITFPAEIKITAIRSCDFDFDGLCDINDIEVLMSVESIVAGVQIDGAHQRKFDLNGDFSIDFVDRDQWLLSAGMENGLRRAYTIGDANLDGQFDSADLIGIFIAGQYEDTLEDNSRWGTGDWNADLDFTTSDLVLALQGGAYRGEQQSSIAPVPEPSGLILHIVGVMFVSVIRRRMRS